MKILTLRKSEHLEITSPQATWATEVDDEQQMRFTLLGCVLSSVAGPVGAAGREGPPTVSFASFNGINTPTILMSSNHLPGS